MENLDTIDRKILFELTLDARIPETQIAKRLRISRDVVHYRIKQLMEKEIIRAYRTWINLAKLGYQGYKVYLKIAGSEKEQKKFFDHIRTREDVFWLGVADGAWDVGLTFFEKSNEEFFRKKNELFARFNKIILDKKTGTVVNVYVYPKKFFAMRETEPGTLFGDVVQNRIDEVERKILKVLMHNSRISLVDLANKVGSTIEVVRHRKKKLEQTGIISVYTASIDYEKLGLEFYKTFIYFDKLDEKNEKKLLEFCRLNENIMHMVRQISPWDIELEVMVENYLKYNKIMRELRSLFPHEIRNIESAIMSGDYPFPAKKTVFD